MDATSFYRQMADYAHWKHTLCLQLRQGQQWLKEHLRNSQSAQHCLQRALTLLENHTFTVACVGEFSRGKTELINALLFTEFGQRLLPSQPGRTTMCPTEIFYASAQPQQADSGPGYVHLLPIETRRTSTSISSFKRIPQNWVSLAFDVSDAESTARALRAVSEVKLVSAADARAMGFDPQQLSGSEGLLEVPRWRHALINLDHPLLRHGLRILDTPGLNALGNEPELTLSTLQQADAVIFLLAADAGLSYSDMAIWQEHLQELRAAQAPGSTITLLNKVDTLWDDLLDKHTVAANILAIREQTAQQLRQPLEQVVAISAKQGLLAQARQDRQLLQDSNLPQLESRLRQQLAQRQLALAEQQIIADAVQIMHTTLRQLQRRQEQTKAELRLLQQQHQPTPLDQQLLALRQEIRQRHQQCHRQQLDLRSAQRQLNQHCQQLRAPLAPFLLEGLINNTHEQMVKSWSFVGLSQAIDEFFVRLQHQLLRIEHEAKAANLTLDAVYQRTGATDPLQAPARHLQLHLYHQRLQQLQAQAQQFCRSLGNIFNSKQRVIGRFINTLVQEVRLMNTDLQAAIDHWDQEALAPLMHEAQSQKSLLDEQMLRLTHLNQQLARESQTGQPAHLQQLSSTLARQELALKELERVLTQPSSPPPSSPEPVSAPVVPAYTLMEMA